MRAPSRPSQVPLRLESFDGALGRQIIDLHVWAVDQGLRGVREPREIYAPEAGS